MLGIDYVAVAAMVVKLCTTESTVGLHTYMDLQTTATNKNTENTTTRSSSVVRRPSSVVRRSSFVVRRSSFVVRRSSFVVVVVVTASLVLLMFVRCMSCRKRRDVERVFEQTFIPHVLTVYTSVGWSFVQCMRCT